jgi:hypothetical protein
MELREFRLVDAKFSRQKGALALLLGGWKKCAGVEFEPNIQGKEGGGGEEEMNPRPIVESDTLSK